MASFKEVLQIVGELYGAGGSVNSQARAFIQHHQKLGIPSASNIGRGQRFRYERDEIYQIAFAVELADFGVRPEIVVEIVRQHWASEFAQDFRREWESPCGDDRLLIFEFDLKTHSWRAPGDVSLSGFSVTTLWASRLAAEFAAMTARGVNSFSVLNVSGLVRKVEAILERLPGVVDTAA